MKHAISYMFLTAPLFAAVWTPSNAFQHIGSSSTLPPLVVKGRGKVLLQSSFDSSESDGLSEKRNLVYQAPPPQFVPPPPPDFRPKSLPVILAGGLLLFASSPVSKQNQPFAKALLQQAQTALNADPTITMELGQNLEAGGIYAAKFATTTTSSTGTTRQQQVVDQLVLQFQIEGGNAWAQGVAYGIRTPNNNNNDEASSRDGGISSSDQNVQLVSLQVANMDASMNGTPLEIPIVPRQ